MKKGLVILLCLLLCYLFSSCNSFEMLNEDNFKKKKEDPDKAAPEFNLAQVSHQLYSNTYNVGDITANDMYLKISNYNGSEPDKVSMGQVRSNQTVYCTFEITNTGKENLILDGDPIIDGIEPYLEIHSYPQFLIKPGETSRFTIKKTNNRGLLNVIHYTTWVKIVTNDPENKIFRFYMDVIIRL